MHPSCLSKVADYVKERDEVVQNIILNLCTSSSTTIRLVDLKQTYETIQDDSPDDCRIKSLTFHNFRTYPSMGQDYGLSFVNSNSEISSMLLVGQNGSGKSTLYTAMERIYKGYSSYAMQMSKSADDYLTFGFATGRYPQDKIWRLVYHLSGKKNDDVLARSNRILPLAVPAFFCSDVDIQKMKNSRKLFLWILEQMGFAKLQNCREDLLDMIKELMKQKDRIQNNNLFSSEEYQELLNAVIKYDAKTGLSEIETCKITVSDIEQSHLYFKENWAKLKFLHTMKQLNGEYYQQEGDLIVDHSQDDSANEFEKQSNVLLRLYAKLASIVEGHEGEDWKLEAISSLLEDKKIVEGNGNVSQFHLADIDSNLKLLDEADQQIKSLQIEIVSKFIESYGESITNIMSQFSNHNEAYNFISTNVIENLELEIHTKLKGDYKTIPHEYFNEFRFKLYCVALKISIAYYWMQQEKKSLPIVLDDIFNANDFENSLKLEHFSYIMKDIYQKNLLDKGFKYPLQLIMTSHDDLVIQSFRRGFVGIVYNAHQQAVQNKFPLIVGKLFRLDELDELDELEKLESQKANNNAGNQTFKSIYRYV